RSGLLEAQIDNPGWLSRLSEDQSRALTAALVGQYKLSGVDFLGNEPPPAESADGVPHLGDVCIPWEQWVELWECDQAGKELPPLLPANIRLLPDLSAATVVQDG